MEIIQERELIEGVSYSLNFSCEKGDYGLRHGGFGFPCDENGEPDWAELSPCALENLDRCLMGEYHYVGVQARHWRYWEPSVGRCRCGEEVYLSNFTNTCDGCGTDYNSAGQELAPRCQWGEETGEHWTECY